MAKRQITRSAIAQAIQRQNPQLTNAEVTQYTTKLEQIVGNHLSSGDTLAFLSKNPDGSYDLTIYGSELIDDD